MKLQSRYIMAVAALAITSLGSTAGRAQEAQVDRTELPIKAPWYPPITTLDARDAKAPPVFEVTAPEKAPNVVVILLDDLGFGGTGAFGGVMDTPEFDKLAQDGLMFTQFHTTALCSPTRQALKTGRNHHSANQAKITEVATSFPGATGMLPNDVASIGEMLRLNGYSTAAYGKWHETAVWEISPSGPFTRWPNYQGFDEFYGFLGGETNQWAPAVYHNQNRVETPDEPANGVIVAQGGRFGGWSLYVKDGTPTFTYNYLGLDLSTATASEKLPKGKATVNMDFAYDGGEKPGAGGTVTLSVNGKSVGTVKVEKTEFSIFSADETAGVGVDAETPVTDDYTRASSRFTGRIDKVTINLKQ